MDKITIYCNCLKPMKTLLDLGNVRVCECAPCDHRVMVHLSNGKILEKLEKELDEIKNGNTSRKKPTREKKVDGRKNNRNYKPCPKCGKMVETRGLYTHEKWCDGMIPQRKRGPGRPPKKKKLNPDYSDIPKHILKQVQTITHDNHSTEIKGIEYNEGLN
ncbi:MAG: hypothetical protein ACFE8P_01175 [Promethearchaeota archaeon]